MALLIPLFIYGSFTDISCAQNIDVNGENVTEMENVSGFQNTYFQIVCARLKQQYSENQSSFVAVL